jgi:hypothetical protein
MLKYNIMKSNGQLCSCRNPRQFSYKTLLAFRNTISNGSSVQDEERDRRGKAQARVCQDMTRPHK